MRGTYKAKRMKFTRGHITKESMVAAPRQGSPAPKMRTLKARAKG